MTQQKNIHETFLSKAISSKNREELTLSMKKTPGEINSLTAYHDFRRVKSINKHLAKIYIVAGIRGTSHLKKLSVAQVTKKIKESRIGNEVIVNSDLISQNILETKKLDNIVIGLEKEKFFLQRKGYIVSKIPVINTDNTDIKTNTMSRNTILLLITLGVLSVFSFISLYFLTLIPVVVALHILLETRQGNFIISPILQQISQAWIKGLSALILSICACIFAIGLFTGSIHQSVASNFSSGYTGDQNLGYFPNEILNHYKNRDITREDLIKILSVAQGIDTNKLEEIDCFKDSFQAEYPKEICHAKNAGYIQGDNLGNFNPGTSISHAAGLKFILNYYGYDVPKRSLYLTYDDLQKNQWFTTYAEFAKRIGLIHKDIKEFHPNDIISIEQVDTYISRLTEIQK